MPAPFDAKAVANHFLNLAERDGKNVTPLQLQKLVYFAHGWHLAITGKPLLKERIEAWKYGPVVPSLYRAFKEFGGDPITRKANRFDGLSVSEASLPDEDADSKTAREVIEQVWKVYGNLHPLQLAAITHNDDTPWAITLKKYPGAAYSGRMQIEDPLIEDYFKRLASTKPKPAG